MWISSDCFAVLTVDRAPHGTTLYQISHSWVLRWLRKWLTQHLLTYIWYILDIPLDMTHLLLTIANFFYLNVCVWSPAILWHFIWLPRVLQMASRGRRSILRLGLDHNETILATSTDCFRFGLKLKGMDHKSLFNKPVLDIYHRSRVVSS